MTPHQIYLVRDSYNLVQPIAPQAAALFYSNLFEADPSLRPLFRGDLAEQGQRLLAMIGAAVHLLERPSELMPVLRKLGARHADYGVQARHYETVGAALIRTLSQGLGDAFADEDREAWTAFYAVVSKGMQEGAMAPA